MTIERGQARRTWSQIHHANTGNQESEQVLGSLEGIKASNIKSKLVSKFITILQCNIGGAPKSRLAKGSTLINYINQYKPTIVVLTETKKTRKNIPSLQGYNLFTQDPLKGSSGGICFYYKKTLRYRISKVLSSTTNSILWVHLQHHITASKDLYICAAYAPHSNKSKARKTSFYEELDGSTSRFRSKPGNLVLAGDYNARLGSITGDHSTNSNKDAFMDYLHNNYLTNVNVIRTYGEYTFHNISNGDKSIIDFLLTDMPISKIPEHEILPGSLGTSAQTAHKAILSKILCSTVEETTNKWKNPRRWRAITHKNRDKFYKSLNYELSKLLRADYTYKILKSALNRAKTNSLGRTRPCPVDARNSSPEVDHLETALGLALQRHTANPTLSNLRRATNLEEKLREVRIQHKTKSILSFLDKIESLHQVSKMRKFYEEVKKKTVEPKDPSFVIWDPNSSDKRPTFSSTALEYRENWARYLERTFAKSTCPPFVANKDDHCQKQDDPIKTEEITKAINDLKNLKAAGMDGITNEDIKLIDHMKPGLLFTILNGIWEEEKCPEEFRQTIIHLFLKPNKPGKTKDARFQKNYRPISLLSSLRKLYEMIIHTRIMDVVSLNQSQFGFLPGRSTVDCMFILKEAILEARYSSRGILGGLNQKLFAAFLDFKGAFDNTPREIVWKKMHTRFGIKGKLLRVIMDLFTGIVGHGVVNGLQTRKVNIQSGVIQGSVLGPVLFLLFIDDLLEALHESKNGIPIAGFVLSVLAYADDITLLSLRTDKLQDLLDICASWATENGMTFSIDKSFAVVFNSKSKKINELPLFSLGETTIKTTYPDLTSETYLGLNITNRVADIRDEKGKKLDKTAVPTYRSSPNPRFFIRAKSSFNRARIGTFHLCQDEAILFPLISTRLYKTLIRSNLLYAMEITDWNCKQILELEKLQAKSLRSLFDLDRKCPKAIVRLLTGVEPIAARRDLHVLMFYAKLCQSNPTNFLGMINLKRTISSENPPIGFYTTVKHTLTRYPCLKYWINIPTTDHEELKSILKQHIWTEHWLRDFETASRHKAPFTTVFLDKALPAKYPYEAHSLLQGFDPISFPRTNLSKALRFWTTPCRTVKCSCNEETDDLANHLLLDCSKTRELISMLYTNHPCRCIKASE